MITTTSPLDLNADRRRGSALLTAVIVILVLGTLAVACLDTTIARSARARETLQKLRVDAMAEAGLSAAIADLVAGGNGILGVDPSWNSEQSDGGGPGPRNTTIGSGDGIPTLGEPGVTLVSFSDDGGYYTWAGEVGEGRAAFGIVASAYQNGITSTIEAVVERYELPPFAGAVYLQWPNTQLDFRGNAFTIGGNDLSWDDTPGPKPALPGIATPWDVDMVSATIPAQRADQVTGAGGEPSVGSGPFHNLNAIAAALEPIADNHMPGGTYTASWGDAFANDFQITYIDGDLHQSGSGSGAGILVVAGDMRLSGSFVWYGAIIVLGTTDIVGGGGTKHVYGTVFVGDSVVETPVTEFEITGTSDIDYSSQSEDALLAMPSYRLSYWKQLR